MYKQIMSINPIALSCTFLAMVVVMCLVVKMRKRRLKFKASRSILSSNPIAMLQDDGRDKETSMPARTMDPKRHSETNIDLIKTQNLLLEDEKLHVPLQAPQHNDTPDSLEIPITTHEEQNVVLEFEKALIESDAKLRTTPSCAGDSSHQRSNSSTSLASYHARRIQRSDSGSCCTCDSTTDGGGGASHFSGGSHLSNKPAYLTIYYASQSGTSAYFASQLQREGTEMGFDIALRSVRFLVEQVKDEPSPQEELRNILVPHKTKRGKQRGRAAFLISTYHEGGPTDDAIPFVELLASLDQHSDCLKGLRYAVFGFGDSGYGQKFNMQGKLYDSVLEQLGAKRIASIGLGDQAKDLEYDFETFKWRKFWPRMANLSTRDCVKPGSMSGDESGEPSGELRKDKSRRNQHIKQRKAAAQVADPDGGFILQVLEAAQSRQCQDVLGTIHPSSRHFIKGVDCPVKQVKTIWEDALLEPASKAANPVMFIELDITPQHDEIAVFKYETGDNVCVLPVNRLSVVEDLANHLDHSLDTAFILTAKDATAAKVFEPPFPSPCTVREFLSFYCELSIPPRRSVLRSLARFTTLARDRDELCRLASSKGYNDYDNRLLKDSVGLADLIVKYFPSIHIPLVEFIRICAPLQPRWYSTSSSSLVDSNSLAITFSVVSFPRKFDDSICHGVCSNYMANLSTVNKDSCRIIKMGSSGFVAPKDPKTALVFVCNGTGISPFRALLQEMNYKRMVLKQDIGPILLFFGIRRRDSDLLFKDELEMFIENGLLSELHLACSREQNEKVYVQHVFANHCERVWMLLREGAHIYVCGASAMANDVDTILRTVSARHLGPVEVNDYMDEIEKEKRYIREGWTPKSD